VKAGGARGLVPDPVTSPAVPVPVINEAGRDEDEGGDEGEAKGDLDIAILVDDDEDAGVVVDVDSGWVEDKSWRAGKEVDKVPTVIVERMEPVLPVDDGE